MYAQHETQMLPLWRLYPFITEENIEVIPQVNLTRTDLDILGDITEALAKCDCLCTCNFLRRVQSEVTKIVEYQEEQAAK